MNDNSFCSIQFPGDVSDQQREELIKLIERSRAKIVAREHIPMQVIPPALLTPEMLEQIRAVVREELQSIMKPPVLDASIMTSEELTERLKDRKSVIQVTLHELTPEQRKLIAEQVKQSLVRDVRWKSGLVNDPNR